MKTAAVLASLVAACLTGSVAHAADLLVPKQFPTIQAAIDAAANGDRVLVSPGAYHEQVNLSGKGIHLIGVGGADVTAIDTLLPHLLFWGYGALWLVGIYLGWRLGCYLLARRKPKDGGIL